MLNCLMLMIGLGILIGVSMFWYAVMRYTFEESLVFSIASLLTLVYLFGLADMILVGAAIFCVFSLLGVILFLKTCIQRGKKCKKFLLDFFNPSFFFLFLVACLGIVLFRKIQINNWDELHQWAKAVNFMLNNDRFAMGDEFSGAEVLLSSTTFFHYCFSRLSLFVTGAINEGNFYVSNLVLWFSGFLLSLSGRGWKKVRSSALFALTIFLLMNIMFVQPYYNIYCDQAVSIWAGAFIVWWIHSKKEKKHLLLAFFMLMNIAFMKSMVGPLFAVVDILLMAVIYLTENGFDHARIAVKGWKPKLFILSILTTPFLFSVLWSATLKNNALVIGAGFIRDEGDRFALTLKSCISKCFTPVDLNNAFPYISYMVFFFFTVLLYMLLKYLYEKGSVLYRIYKMLIVLYGVGFFLYFIVMFYAYMHFFSYADSIQAGSLNRYYSDYIMLGVIPLLYPLFLERDIAEGQLAQQARTMKLLMCLAVLFIAVFGTNHTFINRITSFDMNKFEDYVERKKFKTYRDRLKDIVQPDEKIYFINQRKDGDGFLTVVAEYEFDNQIKREDECYCFFDEGNELAGKVAGLHEFPIQFLPEKLVKDDYAYVWIYQKDSYLKRNFGEMFQLKDIKDGDLYKVVQGDGGYVSLDYIMNLGDKN